MLLETDIEDGHEGKDYETNGGCALTLEGDRHLWDTELRGFGLKITPRGRRIYVVLKQQRGRRHFIRLGEHGELTPCEARRRAQEVLAEIAAGANPSAQRDDDKASPTVSEFAETYLREHAEIHKKASSVGQDRTNLHVHILPALGTKRLRDVEREDIARLHYLIRETPIAANRVRALVAKILNFAEQKGPRQDGSNPCRHVQKYPERARERFLGELRQGVPFLDKRPSFD